ncbi:polynucleotide adenylyltransferase, partial [Oleoguttula sp. CCFEE 5521]
AWSGLCLARLRRLIIGIEELQGSVELAHPFNKGFDRVHEYTTDDEKDKILQGNLDYQVKETQTTDIAADVTAKADADATFNDPSASTAESAAALIANGTAGATNGTVEAANGGTTPEKTATGKQRIYTTTYYVGIGLNPDAKSLDISYAIQSYKNIVTSSDLHDQSVHSIRVIHARNYDLPTDVFNEGEIRPTRVKKQRSAAKRTVSAAGLDSKQETANGVKRPRSSNGATANGTAPVAKGVAT